MNNRRSDERPKRRPHTVGMDIVEQIKALIRSRDLAPGSRLPSERELAEQFAVSRPSIREALGALALAGVIETTRGSGSIVAPSGTNLLSGSFEMMLLIDKPSLIDLYDTRELIEVHLAGRAAERRTGEDLVAIEDALREMGKRLDTPPTMIGAHLRFHMAIATAAHAPVLERIMSCLHEGIRGCIEAASYGVQDWGADHAGHQRIFDAIARKDVTDARRAMTVHMAMAIDNLRRSESTQKMFEVPEAEAIPQ